LDPRTDAPHDWPTVEVVTPTINDDQQNELRDLPHYMAEPGSSRLASTPDEMHTAFHIPPDELTLENLRALSAEVAAIAGAARLLYRQGDPEVMRLVDKANAG
jgi:hypothetical protein